MSELDETVYSGDSDPENCEYSVIVREGVRTAFLDPRLDLANHSPTGLSWGYAGSGPAQLALALLAHATGYDKRALKNYQTFKARVVAKLPRNWKLTRSQVLSELLKIEQEEAMGPRKNPLQPIFRDHNCWACRNGEKPCREGNYNSCSYPHARND